MSGSTGSSNVLRIGFDGRALASPAGGIRRYTAELFGAIGRLDAGIDLVAIGVPRDTAPPRGVSSVPGSFHVPTNLGWTTTGLALAARRSRLDLYHAPAYTAPPWGVRPLVVTIHDVSYARHPEWYPYRRDCLRRAFYRRSALAADLVITDSEFSRREIRAAYGLDDDRIATVPLGVGAPFGPARPDTTTSVPGGTRRPYVLHVGDLHRRRNLRVGLAAVLTLRARRAELRSLQFVLVGPVRKAQGVGQELREAAAEAGQPDALSFIEAPTDEALATLYRAAGAFVYPSRYEGFGLPVLEAMACGIPVVAARAGAIPEVVDSAGLLVEPDDVRGFAEALEAVLLEQNLAARFREASLRRAAQFTWQKTADGTVSAYRRCLARLGARR